MNGTRLSRVATLRRPPTRPASYSGTMAKRSPAETRALEALADAADAARAARKASKRLSDKPARALRRRAAEVAQWAAAPHDVAEHPKQVRRAAEKAAADLRRATHEELRAHTAREQARAALTQQRVRAAMTDSLPVVATVPAARGAGLPALVRPEAARRPQTFGSWVSMATMPEPGWSTDKWATENPPVSNDDALPR